MLGPYHIWYIFHRIHRMNFIRPPAFLLSPNEKTVTNDLDDHARAYTLTVWIVFDRHAEATGFFCSAAGYMMAP